jgi:hypothetical protein
MRIDIYVSKTERLRPRYGFLPTNRPVSLLPEGTAWRYVGSADTLEFDLPEAVEEQIERRGFWAAEPSSRWVAENEP